MHIWPANKRFQNVQLWKFYRLQWMVFRALVASALEWAVCVGWADLHLFLRISSVSLESLQCQFGKKGN
jgi:hypothetical protein